MNDHTLTALRFDRRAIELEARRTVAATAADMLRTTDRSAAEIAGTWHTNANHYSTKADNYARQTESRRFIESTAAAAEWRRLAVEIINQPMISAESDETSISARLDIYSDRPAEGRYHLAYISVALTVAEYEAGESHTEKTAVAQWCKANGYNMETDHIIFEMTDAGDYL